MLVLDASINLLLEATIGGSAMLCHSCCYLVELNTFDINIIWKLCQMRRSDVSLLYGCESQHALPLQYLTARRAVCLATAQVPLQHQLEEQSDMLAAASDEMLLT